MRQYLFIFLLSFLAYSYTYGQIQKISGIITDETHHSLANVSIHILNTENSVISKKDGSFFLSQLAPDHYIFSFTATGYASLQKEIIITDNDSVILIQLHSAINQLDAVTVTAEKREDNLQQLPVSITALTSKQVENYRLWNSNQLTAIIPSLYSDNPGDGRNVTSVRGIVTTSYDPAVATYVDGVNQFSLDTYIPTLTDIERIEVLEGPQGTLYGRNAMGGVINIITKQPTNKTDAFAEINIGNHHLQRYNAGFRAALIKNKLFAGVSFLYTKRDGYYHNDFQDEGYDKQHLSYGNYYLKYLPAERWMITLNVKQQANRNNGTFPLVIGTDEAFANPFHLSQNATATMIDNTVNSSLVVNHAGNKTNLNFISTYQSNYRIYNVPLDGDFSPFDIISVINNYSKPYNKVKVFTQEVRIASSKQKKKLQYTAGAYFFYQDNPVKQGTYYGEFANAAYDIGDSLFTIVNTSKSIGTGIAFYGQLDYEVTPKLKLVGGIRYDYEHRTLTAGSEYQKDDFSFVTFPDSSAKASFHAFSPKLSLQYFISTQNNIYATYSRGYRAGGLSPIPSDPSGPIALSMYSPENSNNYEIGSKNIWFKNKLQVNVTAFTIFINNAQVPTLLLPDAITVIKNTGKLQTRGIETEIAAKLLKGLQIDYNAGITHTEYKSLKLSQGSTEINLTGKKQIYTPATTSSLALQYNVALTKKVKFAARGEWQYRGKMYFDFANSIEQRSYHLLHTRAGIELKHFGLYFWCRNIMNKRYIAYAYDFGAVHLGDPKTFGVTLNTRL